MLTHCTSYFLNTRLDIQAIRATLPHSLFHYEPDELSYMVAEGKYFHLTQYGSLVFLGTEIQESRSIISQLETMQLIEGRFDQVESMEVKVTPGEDYEVEFDHITLPRIDDRIAEIIMIEMAESAALHFYRTETDNLLEQTRSFTSRLERSGVIGIGSKKLRTFIGSVLNLKGMIAENLYLFDTPTTAWKDEFLNNLDKDMSHELELVQRYRSIKDKLDIITENLSMIKDLMQHRHSSVLEWIIIILILIEVVHIFVR